MSANPLNRVRVDRRTTIKWLAATMAAGYAGCSRDEKRVGPEIPPATSSVPAAPVRVAGYGKDPDLMNPAVPWPRTLTDRELETAAALADMIIPADAHSPAASAVGVPDFVDEWVSAPYPEQQADREHVLAGLEWLDTESRTRFGSSFAGASDTQRAELLDLVAWPERTPPELAGRAEFFRRFRWIVVGAYYTTAEGMADVGYLGNTPIAGPYPGPTEEAMAHLRGILEQLGLPAP
ncbi:MAG TPA: gluconate 2-dehydrogenase subunit 3 family protein [Woeseiaceae bacterium]|nr:gluconate 2-dehydrogenase subunit 3 family protein [Woeseiaceae bacterium]